MRIRDWFFKPLRWEYEESIVKLSSAVEQLKADLDVAEEKNFKFGTRVSFLEGELARTVARYQKKLADEGALVYRLAAIIKKADEDAVKAMVDSGRSK